jgi:hypothetical protein
MSYFNKFRKGTFRVGDKVIETVNIAHYSALFEKIADDISFYSYYTVVNGDRLDVISNKLYGTTDYYWTIALLNKDIVNTYKDLPKEYNAELIEYLKGEYPGYALKLATGESLAGKFEIGETVSFSTYTGTVTGKYPTLGYLTIDLTSEDSFPLNQEFTLTGQTSSDTVTIANTVEYYMAPHHYEDADGQWVKWNSGQTSVTSILEYESSENDIKSQLKVIRPDAVYDVVTEFERQMRRT